MTFLPKLPPCVVALEACGTSHYWGRTLRALWHEVWLIPAAYVKPFVKRNKTDARDAAAICVAAWRPDMREVAIKSEEQQALRALERSHELMVKQRTQAMNSLRAMLAEFGVVAAQGLAASPSCGRAWRATTRGSRRRPSSRCRSFSPRSTD